MAKDRDNAFYNYVAPTPTIDASDAAEKAKIKAMSQANAVSRPLTFLEQVENQIAKATARIASLEKSQTTDIYGNPIINPNSVEGRKAKVRADVEAVQAATPKPELTEQEIIDGYTITWIGTTNGRWQKIRPSTATINANRKATEEANWSGSGTKEDPLKYKGKLYTGGKGVGTYKDGVLQAASSNTQNNNQNSSGNDNAAATKYAADLAAASEAAAIKSERMSAWAVLKAEFDKYGLGSLADAVKDMIINGTPSAQATMILRERPEYKVRFAGNEARRTAGLNVYDEGTYLDLENTMAEIFTAYGQKSLMGSTREQQQATFAKYIGATIAPTELKRRMDIATGLSKSDNNTLKAIKQLYPMIGDNDIVAYFLNPQETLPKLETKAQAASIGGAFLQQGLKINSASMEEYAALGISREQAQLGAAQIASVLPRAAQLRSYENGTYTQEQAEDVYLRQSATAKKELEDINKKEIARLSGSAGTSKVSLKSAARNTF